VVGVPVPEDAAETVMVLVRAVLPNVAVMVELPALTPVAVKDALEAPEATDTLAGTVTTPG
jgi:hypothetical protein